MPHRRWQGCVFLLAFLLCSASGLSSSPENSSPELAKIVQTKQAKQARVCEADPQLLRSLAGSEAEVMIAIPNDQLEHIAEFQEEADAWVVNNVARFLPATKITHVLAGDDVLAALPRNADFLVPAMRNLDAALAAAGLDGRVRVSSAMSGEALVAPARPAVAGRVLQFLEGTGSPLFLKSRPPEASDAAVDAAYGAMRALGVPGLPVIAGEVGVRGEAAEYYSYRYSPRGLDRRPVSRRSLAAGTFCVALQNADPAALQAGLNWACGQGADCSAIQPGGPCYKQSNLPVLASYAYNDYYQKMASTGATCSFNGTATTTTTDPSSGSCVFKGSSTPGGSNSSVPVGTSPPTGLTPPAGFAPPSSDLSPPGTFTPPAFAPPSGGFGTPPSEFGPPGLYNGSVPFGGGPSGTLNPYGAGCRAAVSRAGLSAFSAVALGALLVSMDVV